MTDTTSDLPAAEAPARAAIAGLTALGGHVVSLLAVVILRRVV